MMSETSGLGGAHPDDASSLVFTRLYTDLDCSLNVASFCLSINIMDAVYGYRADPKQK